MNSIRMIALINVVFLAFECSAANSSLSVSELLDKYTQALDSTKSFVCHWESEGVINNFVPSLGLKTNNQRVFVQGEVRTDNKGHLYARTETWGYLNQRNPEIAQSDPQHVLFVVGDHFTYRHNKTPGGHKGSLDYREKEEGPWQGPDSYRNGWGGVKQTPVGFFQGYIHVRSRERLDNTLMNAKHVLMRPEPEIVNGSLCYVIEADTQYGDFKIWLDSEHGYHPTRIKTVAGEGDVLGDPGSTRVVPNGYKRDLAIDIVGFEEIEGVWVPTEADSQSRNELGLSQGFTAAKSHIKRAGIVLNPDHGALGSFANPVKNPELDPQLSNGAEVFLGDNIKRVWLNGKAVPLVNESK